MKKEEKLIPGTPEICKGNPGHCDECDHLMLCFPNWEKETEGLKTSFNKEEEKKAEKRLEILLLQTKVDEELEKGEAADRP